MKWTPLKMSLVVIVSLCITAALSSFFIYKNALIVLGAWSHADKIQIFLKTDTSDEEQQNLTDKIKSFSETEAVKLVDRTSAGKNFEKSLKEYASGLITNDELLDLIPITLEVELKKNYSTAERIKKSEELISKIQNEAVIEEINYGAAWMKKFEKIDRFIRNYGLISFLIVLGVISYLVSLMIRVYIDDSKAEIEVYNMLGATRWSIYKLYLKEVLFFLIISFILSLSASFLFYKSIKETLKKTELSNIIFDNLSFLTSTEVMKAAVLLFAVILLHSFFTVVNSVNKLNQINND